MIKSAILALASIICAVTNNQHINLSTLLAYDFLKLENWLDDNVSSASPQENFAQAVKHFIEPKGKGNKGNEGIRRVLAITQRIGDIQECTENTLDMIELIHMNSFAHSSNSYGMVNKILYPRVKHLVDLCEPEHEKSFIAKLQELLEGDEVSLMLSRRLDRMIDDNYFKTFQKIHPDQRLSLKTGSKALARALGLCCRLEDDDLVQLLHNIKEVQGVKKSQEPAGDGSPARKLAELIYENNIQRVCRYYCKEMEDLFDKASCCATFEQGKDKAFLVRRSEAFRLALFRFKICNELLEEPEHYIERIMAILRKR